MYCLTVITARLASLTYSAVLRTKWWLVVFHHHHHHHHHHRRHHPPPPPPHHYLPHHRLQFYVILFDTVVVTAICFCSRDAAPVFVRVSVLGVPLKSKVNATFDTVWFT